MKRFLAMCVCLLTFATTLHAADAWHTVLSSAEGGYWMKRVSFQLKLTDEIQNTLRAQIKEPETPDSNGEMNTTRKPVEFCFKICEPDKNGENVGNRTLPLAGAKAEEIRVCDEKGIEYLFEIKDSSGVPFYKGTLTAGMTFIVPIEVTSVAKDAVFYIYFENPQAWELPEWWAQRAFANGGFEEGKDGRPNFWNLEGVNETRSLTWVTEGVHSGKRAMKTWVADGAEKSWIAARQTAIPVQSGQKWRMSGWTRGENVNGISGWFIHIGNAKEAMMECKMVLADSGTFDWQETVQEFTVPEGCDRVTIGTVLYGTGSVWSDDVTFNLLSESPEVLILPCETRPVEAFPLRMRYPSRTSAAGADHFDSAEFFPGSENQRFSFVKVVNRLNEKRSILVNVDARLAAARWRVPLDSESIELIGLDGQPVPFETWNENMLIPLEVEPLTCSHLLLVEKRTAVSRYRAASEARTTREDALGADAFPGTSLQNVGGGTKSDAEDHLPEPLSPVLASRNLVQNPGFEELDASGNPVHWTAGGRNDGVSFPIVPAEYEVFGNRTAQVKFEPGAKANWEGWHAEVPVRPGRDYLAGLWMKSQAESGAYTMHIHFFNARHEPTAFGHMTTLGQNIQSTTGWRLLTGNISTPEDAAFMQLHLTSNVNAILWFDNVFVSELEVGTPERFQGGTTGVLQVPAIVKVFKDTTFSPNPGFHTNGTEFKSQMAKNEQESLQLAYRFPSSQRLRVAVSPATSKDGQTVLPTEFFVVANVPVDHKTSYYNVRTAPWFRKVPRGTGSCDGWVGYWPDPLIPLRNLESALPSPTTNGAALREFQTLEKQEFAHDSERVFQFGKRNFLEINANETRAFYLIFSTKSETPAGTYHGKIMLRDLNTNRDTEMEYTVEVLDFAIPDRPAVGAVYDIRTKNPEFWNERDSRKRTENMVDFLAKRRIAPDQIRVEPKFTYDAESRTWSAEWEEFDAACERYFEQQGIPYAYMPLDFYLFGWGMPPRNRQGIAPYEGSYPYPDADRSVLRPEFKKVYQDKLRLFWNHVKEKGWSDRFSLYISDEPFYSKPEIIVQMKACCAMIHEVDPAISIYSSTWHHIPEWDGYINHWGVGHYGLVPEKQLKKILARGDRLWWTTDGQMCTDTPYCATERLLPYWCVKYGAEAYEFWGASWYTYDPYKYGWHAFIHQTDQPGVEYYVCYPNGDGFLFYPDKLLGTNEIISSIRLEQAREGVEDAAYLVRLKEEIARVSAMENLAATDRDTLRDAKNTLDRAFDLVHIPNAGGRNTSRYLPNPEEVDEVKSLVMEFIVKLSEVR